MPASDLTPGFIALHGNRTEDLLATVTAWIEAHPLDALEVETVLVQSNGMAEWVKMELARRTGVCAALQAMLPARFQWQTYRQVLHGENVPTRSPLDKTPLAWRLMRLLPTLLDDPVFAPVAGYLGRGGATRRYQLAHHIADLFDQYQVHRPDWLNAWGDGHDILINARGQTEQIPAEQLWQPHLWRAVLQELSEQQQNITRAELHETVLQRLASPDEAIRTALAKHLPRRVVLFGMSHVPLPILELLAALSRHTQVLLALPNPCRFHWADIIDGRELLRRARRRQPLRQEQELATIPLEAMHLHAHPLLAAWGRQGRDFVRLLDAFEEDLETQGEIHLNRVACFDEDLPEDASLLAQVQAHIRDLLPLAEHPRPPVEPEDQSIVFHIAHSPVRELEILHDQLLDLLARPTAAGALRPRDIVVMVPAIDRYAPAIHAVFGQYERSDPRYIPFAITDMSTRASSPLISALEWLLRLRQDRCQLSDLTTLLQVPAIAARFGVDAEGLPRLAQWMTGAGMRWGLDFEHRRELGLEQCGEQNTMRFGLQRMLMGYAVGSGADIDEPLAGIEPYDEVGGLDAELAGSLARLLECLMSWQENVHLAATPAEWAERLRALIDCLIWPQDETDRQTVAALEHALTAWVEACDEAGFEDAVELDVATAALFDTLETPRLEQRFRAGGITFCTLMPMRAIPFEVVCLLGMNDGEYPRRTERNAFDLMSRIGQQRPGDRARRDDDRQLMLEALLAARRTLYISWCGRNIRDNSAQPPSVMVAQLRDYLAQGWGPEVLEARTVEHPLQPFSRRYFEGDARLHTHALEWRTAHEDPTEEASTSAPTTPTSEISAAPFILTGEQTPLTLAQLLRFIRNPVKEYFRQRLEVDFELPEHILPDVEPFSVHGLEKYVLHTRVLDAVRADLLTRADNSTGPEAQWQAALELQQLLDTQLQRLQRSGDLPMGTPGVQAKTRLQQELLPMLHAWQRERRHYNFEAPRLELRFEHNGLALHDWLDQRRGDATGQVLWMQMRPSRLLDGKTAAESGVVRPYYLLEAWLTCLLQAAAGHPGPGLLIGLDATVTLPAIDPEMARTLLANWLETWQEGMQGPLPLPPRTAIAYVQDEGARAAYEGGYAQEGENSNPALARCFPDFNSLSADGRLAELAERHYRPLLEWVDEHVTALPHSAAF